MGNRYAGQRDEWGGSHPTRGEKTSTDGQWGCCWLGGGGLVTNICPVENLCKPKKHRSRLTSPIVPPLHQLRFATAYWEPPLCQAVGLQTEPSPSWGDLRFHKSKCLETPGG